MTKLELIVVSIILQDVGLTMLRNSGQYIVRNGPGCNPSALEGRITVHGEIPREVGANTAHDNLYYGYGGIHYHIYTIEVKK